MDDKRNEGGVGSLPAIPCGAHASLHAPRSLGAWGTGPAWQLPQDLCSDAATDSKSINQEPAAMWNLLPALGARSADDNRLPAWSRNNGGPQAVPLGNAGPGRAISAQRQQQGPGPVRVNAAGGCRGTALRGGGRTAGCVGAMRTCPGSRVTRQCAPGASPSLPTGRTMHRTLKLSQAISLPRPSPGPRDTHTDRKSVV